MDNFYVGLLQIFCIMTTIFKMAAKIYVNIKLLQTSYDKCLLNFI